MAKIEVVDRKQLSYDPQNANRGTKRGREMVRESLKRHGAGRSLLLDKNGTVIAGNKTLEGAEGVLPDEVIVVKTDGTQLIAIQRTDVEGDEAVLMALADNRSSQVGLDWDPVIMSQLSARNLDMSHMFGREELARIMMPVLSRGAGDPGCLVQERRTELLQKYPVETSDIWTVGENIVGCGDCTDEEFLKTVTGGRHIPFVFTSPPYAEQRKQQYGGVPADEYPAWWGLVQNSVRQVLSHDASFFLNIKPHTDEFTRRKILSATVTLGTNYPQVWQEILAEES